MNYYIEVINHNKARQDVDRVFRDLGYTNLTPQSKSVHPVSRFITKLTGVIRILTTVKRGDTLCLQYPMKKFYYMACTFAHWKGAYVATIIHDLGAFRRHKLTPEQENSRLKKTDFLIAHNDTMKQYLIEKGFKGHICSLGIFDFIVQTEPKDYDTPHVPRRVFYASNLKKWRNGFLYALQGVMNEWEMTLYGHGFDEEGKRNPKLKYAGSLPEDQLIAEAEADFGLVWDGNSIDECDGDWGSYLKINNPHKTSLYLRAGVPVIIWNKAAIAPFIESKGLGVSVGSLKELDEVFRTMTSEEYNTLKANAKAFSKLLGEGRFVRKAFVTAQQTLTDLG